MTRHLALLTCLAAAFCALPAAALAKPPKKAVVKEGVGVAGVNLGMTQAQALKKWGKPDGGKCQSSQGITPAFTSCSWTVTKDQLVSIKVMKKKVVSISPFGKLWKTSKGARAGKTTFAQLKKLYKGAREVNTCALDFGHILETGSGKKVTAFAAGYRTTDSDPYLYLTVYNSKATGGADGGPGRPVNRAGGCGAPQSGGPPPPTNNTMYTVSGSTDSSGGSVTASSSSAGADCSVGSSCSVKPGSSVTLTATLEPGYHFLGWRGDCSGTSNTFTFDSVDSDKSCTASFERDPEPDPVD